MDEEEKYLIKISDTDAYSEDHFINYTGLPMLKVLMWRPWILAELDAHHLRSQHAESRLSLFQLLKYYAKLVRVRIERGWGGSSMLARLGRWLLLRSGQVAPAAQTGKGYDYVSDSGYFNIHGGLKFAPLLMNPLTRRMFYPLLAVAVAIKAGSPAQARAAHRRAFALEPVAGLAQNSGDSAQVTAKRPLLSVAQERRRRGQDAASALGSLTRESAPMPAPQARPDCAMPGEEIADSAVLLCPTDLASSQAPAWWWMAGSAGTSAPPGRSTWSLGRSVYRCSARITRRARRQSNRRGRHGRLDARGRDLAAPIIAYRFATII